MDTETHPTPRRPRLHRLAALVVAVAVLLAVLVALTDLDASTASGLFVGGLVGGGLAFLVALAGRRIAIVRMRRQADAATLDRLEPLRRDQP